MSRLYGLVVFDWEGTLGDPLGQVLHLLAEQAKHLGFPACDPGLARRYVPLGLDRAVKKLFPTLALYQHERLLMGVQRALQSHHGEQILFPGALALIQSIQQADIHLAIATNKGSQSLQRALHLTGLTAYFPITRSADQVPPKPCPQMLEEIMEAWGMAPSATLMIGDSVSDIEMARQAQVVSVGVDFYHQQADDLRAAGADQVFDDYVQLGRYLALPNYLNDTPG
jgi:phosphoglycolate phosphatase